MNGNNIVAIGGIVIKELYRRKDFYVLFILTVLITLLAGAASFVEEVQVSRHLKELCLSLIWLCSLVIVIGAAARQIPAERESRTIFPLLAKPVTRADVLIGKFAGCWAAGGLALIVFYLFFGVVVSVKSGDLHVLNYLQAAWLHWILLGIVVAVSLLGSLLFTSVAANVTICFVMTGGILLVGRHLGKVARDLTEPLQTVVLVIYHTIPQLQFFDTRQLIVHDWPLIPAGAVALATLYGLIYTGFFLLAGWLAFRRKALN